MDLPNITLFFQMGHFFLAYIILKKLIFRPALALLEAQEIETARLAAKNNTLSDRHSQLCGTQKSRWGFIKKSLYNLMPARATKACFDGISTAAPLPPVQPLSKESKDTSIDLIKKNLEKVQL